MQTIDCYERLWMAAYSQNPERSTRWLKAATRLGTLVPKGVALLADVTQVGQLDCALVNVENDIALAILRPNPAIIYTRGRPTARFPEHGCLWPSK